MRCDSPQTFFVDQERCSRSRGSSIRTISNALRYPLLVQLFQAFAGLQTSCLEVFLIRRVPKDENPPRRFSVYREHQPSNPFKTFSAYREHPCQTRINPIRPIRYSHGLSGTKLRTIRNESSVYQERIFGLSGTHPYRKTLLSAHLALLTGGLTFLTPFNISN